MIFFYLICCLLCALLESKIAFCRKSGTNINLVDGVYVVKLVTAYTSYLCENIYLKNLLSPASEEYLLLNQLEINALHLAFELRNVCCEMFASKYLSTRGACHRATWSYLEIFILKFLYFY